MSALIEEVAPDGLSKRFWRFSYNGWQIYLVSAGRCERKTTRHKWIECHGGYAAGLSRIPAPAVPRRAFDRAREEFAANIPTTIQNVEIDEVAS